MRDPGPEQCCYCGTVTDSGIYLRENPEIPRFCPESVTEGPNYEAGDYDAHADPRYR